MNPSPATHLPTSVYASWAPSTRDTFDAVLVAIRVHGEELLSLPGVVAVRPGYRFRRACITSQPAIIVSVLRKQDLTEVPVRQLIPRKLGNVLVDVVPANPEEQLRFFKQATVVAAAGGGNAPGFIDLTLPGDEDPESLGVAAVSAPYVPPAEPLDPVEEEMTIVCHASPDAGWKNLQDFLLGTQERLTIAMYEFHARHILAALRTALPAPRTLRLILDGGPQNVSSGGISNDQVKQDLGATLGASRLTFTWAPVTQDNRTTQGFFPSAYHTKVAVRDGSAFWLSSGNWKSSSQPEANPLANPLPLGFDPVQFQRRSNREWHVIVESPALARRMEAFITHDIEQAQPLQVPGAQPAVAALPDLFVASTLLGAAAATAPPQFQPEKVISRQLRVRPLFTPDNYAQSVLPLIQGTQRKLYFQVQNLTPRLDNPRFRGLVEALREKSQDPNIDVRILVRGDFSAATVLQTLQAHGFEMSRVKLQNGCHNKGIVIDDRIVILGSHNWTGQGTTENRDASLIFDDEEIARYYSDLFLHDWDNLSRFEAEELEAMPQIAAPGEPVPPGMARVAWHDYFED